MARPPACFCDYYDFMRISTESTNSRFLISHNLICIIHLSQYFFTVLSDMTPIAVLPYRMHFDKFELAKYADGLCIRDTFTILGKGLQQPVTPICGNMTNWASTCATSSHVFLQARLARTGSVPYYQAKNSVSWVKKEKKKKVE